MDTLTLAARWVFPVAGRPLERGTVTIRGDTIEAVEPAGVRAPDLDLGNVAIIPGLVNAHTHLDLTGARGKVPPTDPDHFTDWLHGVIAFRRSRTPEQVRRDIRRGLKNCLDAGTTLIGDISTHGKSWDALSKAPTRAVVFHEMLGLSVEKAHAALVEQKGWELSRPPHPRCRPGASPHAPYSAAQMLGYLAAAGGAPVAMHLAEWLAETELLEKKSGVLLGFLESLGVWDPGGIADGHDKILTFQAEAASNSRPPTPLIYAHCNYLTPDMTFAPHQSVAYCPRTHAAFGHPVHPFREFLARGVRVCLGTDSLASNPDLDILAEARFLRQQYPDFPGRDLLRMLTLSGAEALGWAEETGSLEPGKSADLVVIPLPDREADDPHAMLFAADAPQGNRRTMFRGEWR